VPKGTIEEAVRYLERCRTPEGGICYSFGSGPDTRLPITAAAIATLYNAGEYDSRLADSCMAYTWKQFELNKGWSKTPATISTPTSTPRRPSINPATRSGTSISPARATP